LLGRNSHGISKGRTLLAGSFLVLFASLVGAGLSRMMTFEVRMRMQPRSSRNLVTPLFSVDFKSAVRGVAVMATIRASS